MHQHTNSTLPHKPLLDSSHFVDSDFSATPTHRTATIVKMFNDKNFYL